MNEQKGERFVNGYCVSCPWYQTTAGGAVIGLLIIFAIILICAVWESVSAQVFCAPVGSSTYCDTKAGAVTITPLTPTQGVIMTPKSVEAYTILPPIERPLRLERVLDEHRTKPDPFGALMITEPEDVPDPMEMLEE